MNYALPFWHEYSLLSDASSRSSTRNGQRWATIAGCSRSPDLPELPSHTAVLRSHSVRNNCSMQIIQYLCLAAGRNALGHLQPVGTSKGSKGSEQKEGWSKLNVCTELQHRQSASTKAKVRFFFQDCQSQAVRSLVTVIRTIRWPKASTVKMFNESTNQ